MSENPKFRSVLNDIMRAIDMPAIDIDNQNGRLSSTNSIDIPLQEIASRNSTITYGSIQRMPLLPSVQSADSSFDPLSFLIPMTDAVLIITAIIFIMAIGIVSLLTIMAIVKIHFSKSELNSFWTNEWFTEE